ncbi:MAG TPA: alpha-mannosidase, partial [Clostridia bacterium]|nr:alpha-mannosidase [Clostridia bacterium]
NHGGGPSKKDLDDIRGLMKQSDDEIVHTYPDKFFEEYLQRNQNDRVIKRSLHSFSVGCYTSMVRVKQKHRELENKLLLCEKMMSHAVSDEALENYEHQMLREAWKNLLFCEFHDALPGSSIQIVENDILKRLDHGLDIADRLIFRSYFRLVKGQKPAKEGEYPVLVYNPHPYRVRTIVECEYCLAEQNRVPDTFSKGDVFDEEGKLVPCQNEKESSNIPIDWIKRVAFQADLAPMSVNRFNIVNRLVEKKPFELPKTDENYIYFDNGTMQSKVNRKTGLIDSYKVNNIEYIKPGMCRLLVIQDNTDSWGMTVSSYQKMKGKFKLATPSQAAKICGVDKKQPDSVRVVESNELRTVVEASFVYSQSSCNIRYTFNKTDNIIGVNVRVFSQDKSVMYKLS